MFYNERRNKLYCAKSNHNDETVTVIDCSTETPVATIDLTVLPSSLAYDSVGDRLYCLSTRDNYVAVVDCQRDTMVKLLRVGLRPVAAACAFNFRRMYVANRYGSSLSVIRDSVQSGIETPDDLPAMLEPAATVVRRVLFLPEATSPKLQAVGLLEVSGRKVLDLHPGANDVSGLAPGVYFIREDQTRAVRKVVVTR